MTTASSPPKAMSPTRTIRPRLVRFSSSPILMVRCCAGASLLPVLTSNIFHPFLLQTHHLKKRPVVLFVGDERLQNLSVMDLCGLAAADRGRVVFVIRND